MNTTSSSSTTFHRILFVLIVFIGLSIRIVFNFSYQKPPASDELDYHSLASNLSSIGTYGSLDKPTAYRPVGYPAFLAIVYFTFGNNPLFAKIVQSILDTLTAILLFIILRSKSLVGSFLVLSLWLFYPPAILYSNLLLSETLFSFLLVLLGFILLRENRKQFTHSLLIGIIVGFLALIKSWFLIILFLLLLFHKKLSFSKKDLAVLLAGLFCVIAPWVVRNFQRFDTFSLSLNGGINLYIGNNPKATGGYFLNLPETMKDISNNEKALNSIATKEALSFILARPEMFFINGFKKIARTFSSQGELLVFSFVHELVSQSQRYAKKYATLPVEIIILGNFPFFFILILGMLGFISSSRDMSWQYTCMILSVTLFIHFIFFGGSRFLFPVMPFVSLFASLFLLSWKDRLRSMNIKNVVIAGSIILFFVSIWSYEFYLISAH